MCFQEEDENIKSLRTTHDGRKRTAIAHLSLRLRWAKKTWVFRCTTYTARKTNNFSNFLARNVHAPKTWISFCFFFYSGGSQGGATGAPPPPPLKLDQLYIFSIHFFFIRMLKNKAQIAQESIKITLELPGPLTHWVPDHIKMWSGTITLD